MQGSHTCYTHFSVALTGLSSSEAQSLAQSEKYKLKNPVRFIDLPEEIRHYVFFLAIDQTSA